MTATQHGGPGAPYGQPGAPVPGGPPVPPGAPPGYDWRYAPPPPRRSKVLAAGVVAAILLATAALVVGIVDLTRSTPTPVASVPTSAAPTTTPGADTGGADHALCTAIGPLMAEGDQTSNAYIRLGEAGSPERDNALPKFVSDTQNWVGRVQPILDQNPDASAYLRRTLQRMLDDESLMVADMKPGPLTSYAKALWADSLGAYAGPLHVCDGVGVRW
jgi:hypothetical protein